jgi:hypothetical protein
VPLLLPPLSADELLPAGNEDPSPSEDEAADEDECELFFANNWSCVSESTNNDEDVIVVMIIVSRSVFDATFLLSCNLASENFPRKMFKHFIYQT